MPSSTTSGPEPDEDARLLAQLLDQVWALASQDGDRCVTVSTEHFTGTIVATSAVDGLSPRETEVVRLVARGLPNKAIARALEISPHTVSSHLRRIFAKMDVTNRSELVALSLGRTQTNTNGNNAHKNLTDTPPQATNPEQIEIGPGQRRRRHV